MLFFRFFYAIFYAILLVYETNRTASEKEQGKRNKHSKEVEAGDRCLKEGTWQMANSFNENGEKQKERKKSEMHAWPPTSHNTATNLHVCRCTFVGSPSSSSFHLLNFFIFLFLCFMLWLILYKNQSIHQSMMTTRRRESLQHKEFSTIDNLLGRFTIFNHTPPHLYSHSRVRVSMCIVNFHLFLLAIQRHHQNKAQQRTKESSSGSGTPTMRSSYSEVTSTGFVSVPKGASSQASWKGSLP